MFDYSSAEGYLCPYKSIGYDGKNSLIYDYYDMSEDGSHYIRKGETGWQNVNEYCRQKGDLSIHPDAGENKCNDSHGLCNWNSSECEVVKSRKPDCLNLCKAVLAGKGPQCLGNCNGGQQSNNLYSVYRCTNRKQQSTPKRVSKTC